MEELSWISAFLLGLMGAPHCAGMCGGIVTALSIGSQPGDGRAQHRYWYVLAYNLGRMSSYTLAGLLVGGLSALAANLLVLHQAQQFLMVLAALFMLLLGLYMGGWWPFLAKLERLGGHLWRYIEPVARRFIPVRNLRSAFIAGTVWGWLPCGLVYTGLIYSTTSGGAFQGGVLMLCFGLGTLPAMLLMGAAGVHLQGVLQQIWLRRLAATVVIAFACYMLLSLFMR